MITITHYRSGSVGVHCRPGEALYALGLKPAEHPMPVPMQAAWYSRVWQTKPNPYSSRMYLELIRGHFELMRWL